MRLTHPDPDMPDLHTANTVAALEAAQGQGYELAEDVDLLDPAAPGKPVRAKAKRKRSS